MKVDGRLHDIRPGGASRVENRLEVGEHALGLSDDVAGNDLPRSGIEGNLAGGEEKPVGDGGLRIRADGRRGIVSLNRLQAHETISDGGGTKSSMISRRGGIGSRHVIVGLAHRRSEPRRDVSRWPLRARRATRWM